MGVRLWLRLGLGLGYLVLRVAMTIMACKLQPWER